MYGGPPPVYGGPPPLSAYGTPMPMYSAQMPMYGQPPPLQAPAYGMPMCMPAGAVGTPVVVLNRGEHGQGEKGDEGTIVGIDASPQFCINVALKRGVQDWFRPNDLVTPEQWLLRAAAKKSAKDDAADKREEEDALGQLLKFGVLAAAGGLMESNLSAELGVHGMMRAANWLDAPPITLEKTNELLITAVLAAIAYKPPTEVAQVLDSSMGFTLLESSGDTVPSWFLAHGLDAADEDAPQGAIYLVFRGTQKKRELLLDAMFLPPEKIPEEIGELIGGSGSASSGLRALFSACPRMHSGFLLGIMKCLACLQSALRQHLRNGIPFYLVGHSLGGSLAMAAASIMTHVISFTGERRVIMFGSPPIHYEIAPSTDDMEISATLVVNECDVVPRLLGSSPTTLKTFFDLLVSTTSNKGQQTASLRQTVDKVARYIQISSDYVHPEGLKLVVLKGRKASEIPEDCHRAWLSLDSTFEGCDATSLVKDHKVEEAYVDNLAKILEATKSRRARD